jgi:hypothetical protein
MPIIPKFDDFEENSCTRLSAAARKIEEKLDHEAVILELDATEKNIMLMHIERYVATPFGYFPSLV